MGAAKRDCISIYFLFMDDDKVVHERHAKLSGGDKDTDFTVELEQPISTIIHGLKLWVRT